MDELNSNYTQNIDLAISSSSSSGDDWESEEDEKDIKYQPLPQDPIENNSSDPLDNCSDDGEDVEEVVKSKDVKDISPDPGASGMDEGHANVVVKAMAGFSLSPSSIPEWAKVIPEEVWKNELLAGLKSSKSNSR